MDKEYQMRENYLIIHIGKELDHHRAEYLRTIMAKIDHEREIKNIIFDFTGTTFMDSSGVGMMISRYKDLSMSGGYVYAVGICPIVEKLFYVSGLHKIIKVYSEVEDVFNGQK